MREPSTDPVSEIRCWPSLVLRAGVCACFAGWAWQHLRWGAPYDVMLWSPGHFGWLARMIGVSWENYVAEVMTDGRILLGVRLLGLFYAALAVLALTAKRNHPLQLICLGIGSFGLAMQAFCKFIKEGEQMVVFVEQGSQILAPWVLILALRRGAGDRRTLGTALLAFWMTFAGHGIFAIGWAPTPGHFYGLTHAIFGFGERAADLFLKGAGALDFLVCAAVLWPRMRQAALTYAVLWGALTGLARPVAGMSLVLPWWGADQFLHEAVYRAPHAALPLFLLLVFRKESFK